MAGDPLKSITSGIPFAPSAQRENLISEMLRDWLNTSTRSKTPVLDRGPSGTTFLVENLDDEVVPQYGALKYDSVLIHPVDNLLEFKARLAFHGQKPNHNGDEARLPFMIAQEPIAPGAIGRCIADGFTIAKVDVLNETHLYVEGTGSSDHLQTAVSGTGIATLHFRERTGTGVMYCVIRIGPPSAASAIESAKDNSNGSSCNEMRCMNIPGLTDNLCPPRVPIVDYYSFFAGTLDCSCTQADAAGTLIKLYEVDHLTHNVYESPHVEGDPTTMLCKGTNDNVETCTVTATWKWGATCGGTCGGTYTYTNNGDPFPGTPFIAQAINYTCGSCTGEFTGCLPDCSGAGPYFIPGHVPGSNCDFTSLPHGESVTVPAVGDCTSSGGWVLQGVDDDTCNCTPLPPDFDGEPDDEATTTCTGTKPTDCTEEQKISFWRLTIAVDYYGKNATTLEFIVGADVRLSYYADNTKRLFCRDCINSFRTATCRACLRAPSIICLQPTLDSGTVVCTGCKGSVIPRRYAMMVEYGPGANVCGVPLATFTAGPFLSSLLEGCFVAFNCFAVHETDDEYADMCAGDFETPSREVQVVFSPGPHATLSYNGDFLCDSGDYEAAALTSDQDISTGDGCNQILTFSGHNDTPFGGGDITFTLYPIPPDSLA
jgi:hypothetical protein